MFSVCVTILELFGDLDEGCTSEVIMFNLKLRGLYFALKFLSWIDHMKGDKST